MYTGEGVGATNPCHPGHITTTTRVCNRGGLDVAAAKVTVQSINGLPRCRTSHKPPRVFIHPKTCPPGIRFRWLTV